jgi:hypothetical protein
MTIIVVLLETFCWEAAKEYTGTKWDTLKIKNHIDPPEDHVELLG